MNPRLPPLLFLATFPLRGLAQVPPPYVPPPAGPADSSTFICAGASDLAELNRGRASLSLAPLSGNCEQDLKLLGQDCASDPDEERRATWCDLNKAYNDEWLRLFNAEWNAWEARRNAHAAAVTGAWGSYWASAAAPAPSATQTYLCQKCRERSKHACEVKDQSWVTNSVQLSTMYRMQCNDTCIDVCR